MVLQTMLLPRCIRPSTILGRGSPHKPIPLIPRPCPRRRFFQQSKTQFRWNAYEPPPKDHPASKETRQQPQKYQRQNEPPRFSRIQWLRYKYKTSSGFRFFVRAAGAGYVIFIIYNIEKVPETGRWRFNCVSQGYEEEFGKSAYKETMNQYRSKILPDMHPETIRVRKVLNRLIPAIGLKNQEWEVHVIDDEEANAFVVPG